MHVAFVFLVKLLCQSTSLLTFLLFSPYPMKEVSEQKAGQLFGCWRRLTHHTQVLHLVDVLVLSPMEGVCDLVSLER